MKMLYFKQLKKITESREILILVFEYLIIFFWYVNINS